MDDVEVLMIDDNIVNEDEFKTSIINDVLLTTKENSIISNFEVIDNKCKITSTKIEQSGKRDVLHEARFDYNEEFKNNFIEDFITNYVSIDTAVINDINDSDTLGKVNFRMVTENNDMLVIVGIDLEYANKLSDLISSISNKENDKIYVKNMNEAGVSNVLIIVLTIVLIGLLLVGAIFFTMANR